MKKIKGIDVLLILIAFGLGVLFYFKFLESGNTNTSNSKAEIITNELPNDSLSEERNLMKDEHDAISTKTISVGGQEVNLNFDEINQDILKDLNKSESYQNLLKAMGGEGGAFSQKVNPNELNNLKSKNKIDAYQLKEVDFNQLSTSSSIKSSKDTL
jgi:hypothetical protein